ncbi:MAG: hypothetical protein IPJ40_17895 [Saprospirales bacterium]|nr:hypothetical protein [Saprospirales bacterium]
MPTVRASTSTAGASGSREIQPGLLYPDQQLLPAPAHSRKDWKGVSISPTTPAAERHKGTSVGQASNRKGSRGRIAGVLGFSFTPPSNPTPAGIKEGVAARKGTAVTAEEDAPVYRCRQGPTWYRGLGNSG